MDANDENVGLFGVFSRQTASHMEARKNKALTWVLDAHKSEEYRAARTHVARLLAQVWRLRITKGLFEVRPLRARVPLSHKLALRLDQRRDAS